MFLLKNPFLTDAPADGAAGGGGAAVGAAPAAGGSALAQGAGDPVAIDQLIPEKFRSSKDDGTFDLEATTRKLATSYAELEKLKGKAEQAPETPEAYAPEVQVDGFKWDEVKADPKMQGFLKRFHAKGITNSQLSEVLSAYHEAAADLLGGDQALTAESCQKQLGEVWKSPEEMKAGQASAFRAFNAFAEKAGVTLQQLEESGAANNPYVLRLLAAIAPELSEDRGANVNNGGGGSASNLQELMAHPAYADPKHPEHAKISEQIRKAYEKQYGTAA